MNLICICYPGLTENNLLPAAMGHPKFYGTQHYGRGRFQNRPLARLLISSLSLSRVGTFPDLYNRVFEKKRRQLVKKIELDENGLRLV